MGSTDVLCPVCTEPCHDLPHHLECHSKEEIIRSLSGSKYSQDNLSDRNVTQNIENLADSKRAASVLGLNDGNIIRGESSFATCSSFSSPLSYGTNLPNKSSLIKNTITDGNSVLANTHALGGSFPQNETFVPQIAPQAYTVVYQQPNVYQHVDGTNSVNAPGLIHNYNQNSIVNSQSIRSSVVNQPMPQTEVVIPQSNSRVINNGNNLNSKPHIRINSDVSGVPVNAFPGSTLLSNNLTVPNNSGNQHVFCLLPYSQVQPSFPGNGNLLMYNNNLLSGSGNISGVLQQQCGLSYLIGGNSPSMSVNNSQMPNHIYYLPSNFGAVGARQDGQQSLLQSQNVIVNKNISQQAASLLSVANSGSSIQAQESTSYVDKTVLPLPTDVEHTSADKISETETETVTTLKIGDNIKISLPKDIAEKKDRLKELINRELCRAIILNDSGKLESNSLEERENIVKENCHEKKNKDNSMLKLSNNFNVKSDSNNIDLGNSNTPNCDFEENYSSQISPLPGNFYAFESPYKSLPALFSPDRIIRNISKSADSPPLDPVIPKIFTDKFSKNNSIKLEDESSTPGVSGIKPNVSVNSSSNLLLPSKNINFLDTLSNIALGSDHELGAVEEVHSSDTLTQTTLDCKPCEPSSSKYVGSFCFDSSIDNLGNQESVDINSDLRMPLVKDTFPSPKKLDRYAKTYFRARKASKSVVDKKITLTSSSTSQITLDSSQINLKFKNLTDDLEFDEEIIDDPLYDDVENSSFMNDDFMNEAPKSKVLENEPLSDESKGYLSVYQGIPVKLETGESNGTLAEEVLSLKASETLADSDSERATPNEEVTEMYYGKSCIFAGEPGPPNLSSQRYTPIEPAALSLETNQHEEQSSEAELLEETQNMPSQVIVEVSVNSVRDHGKTPEEDTISLILDGNCSIVPADSVRLPHLLDHNQGSSQIFHSNFLKKENSSEEIMKQQFSNFPEEMAFVTTGIVDNCLIPVSPHASTSGLQNLEKDFVKKNCIDDEDYDFEYESDGYGDSDFSDSTHQQKSRSSDLEKWRCNRCNQTFKSLKEKLLHSGHHSPCSVGGKSSSQEEYDTALENSSECLNSKSVILKEEDESSIVTSSEKVHKLSSKKNGFIKGKKKVVLNKVKPESNTGSLENATAGVLNSTEEFSCTECSCAFSTLEQLYEHRKMALKSRYMCPVCHIEFQNRIEKLRHIKTHPTSDFVCSICHRSFDNFHLWSKHQLFHMGLIFYECKECGYKCQRRGELKVHYRKHSGEKPFSCETCLRSFVSSQSLKRHLLVHMEGQEAECDICFKRYKNGLVLNKHKLKIHSKKKMFIKKRTDFICETCNEVFRSEKKLTWHQETHKRWPKKCQTCGECFIHQANLTKHIRRKHDANYMPPGTDKESTVCHVCKKVYKRSSLPLHMRIHNGVKPYKCNVCSKEFTVKCNFDSHKWTHAGTRDRPYKCKLCDRSYHLHGLLDMHIRSHKKIRPYTCNECGKSFIRKNNYQTHKALHTGEKQHECKICNKTFFRKYNLNNHIRIHTGETPYECTICRKEFAQKSNYNVHMKAFHVERHAIHEEV